MSRASLCVALPGLALAGLALAGCRETARDDAPATPIANEVKADAQPAPPPTASRWELLSSGEGVGLRLLGGPAIHLFCAAGGGQLLVNLRDVDPIGSEERLSLGSGTAVVALVADTSGDALRGGVSADGAVPDELDAILSGPVSASYGRQQIGPVPPPTASDRRAFVAGCSEKPAAAPAPAASAAACHTQDGKPIAAPRLRAIGTEPFWGAQSEGRCITYSTPDDQKGTRVWTRFSAGAGGGTWSGALGGRQFELRTRTVAPPGCSDGMSDNLYPLGVTLRVGGETRTGCAKPL